MARIALRLVQASGMPDDPPLPQPPRRPLLRSTLRIAWCLAGAATGLSIVLTLVTHVDEPLLLASLGGTAVFLFGLTRADAAQPRALFGGHLGGALIGVICYQSFGGATWVYVLAVLLTLLFMLVTRTVHPPAGANPLIMVHTHASFAALWNPVALGILVLAVTAVVWSRLIPGLVRYPRAWFPPSPPFPTWGGWTD